MSEMFGGFERRRPRTVMPVPMGTALHQLYSVPPTVRTLGSEEGVSSDMLASFG